MNFLDSDVYNENAALQKAIGFLHHVTESSEDRDCGAETCFIDVALDQEVFEALLFFLRLGRLPDRIDFTAGGFTYGWEPDGSGKVWGVEVEPRAPVMEVRFNLPLIAA